MARTKNPLTAPKKDVALCINKFQPKIAAAIGGCMTSMQAFLGILQDAATPAARLKASGDFEDAQTKLDAILEKFNDARTEAGNSLALAYEALTAPPEEKTHIDDSAPAAPEPVTAGTAS